MDKLTKKRGKALAIDFAVSGAVNAVVEALLRKKIKQEWVHALVTPTALFWGLEYLQLKTRGQTLGQQVAGIKIDSADGGELTDKQILKRLAHRDSIMPLLWFRERRQDQGEQMPHDRFAHTVVRELKKQLCKHAKSGRG
ncbi:RDD family protein [Planococcus sp. ISL-109]|uniref:RDD family protein n=1 Tax=Planococcus sp. ISL-109 TaxID=2819166 RepID=UPI001BEB70C6|nr:RDD family protein [Planococcus sp. ISL-109]MBT2582806.1 RDD family protein [Planococcus sp. ISL-109]